MKWLRQATNEYTRHLSPPRTDPGSQISRNVMLWSAARRCGPDGDRPLLENAGKKKTPPRRLCTPCRAINDRLGFPEEGGEGEGMDGDVPSLRLPLLMSVCWTRRCKCSLPPSDTRCLLVLALFCFPCTNDVCVCVFFFLPLFFVARIVYGLCLSHLTFVVRLLVCMHLYSCSSMLFCRCIRFAFPCLVLVCFFPPDWFFVLVCLGSICYCSVLALGTVLWILPFFSLFPLEVAVLTGVEGSAGGTFTYY